MPVRFPVKSALLASAFGALLCVPAAQAQDNGRYNDAAYSASDESVIVTAPHFRVDRSSPLGVPDKLSLSRAVPYDDLDLRTRDGARELRQRVAEAAHDVCDQLADAYPVREANGTSCYRSAHQDAMLRADAAIRDARNDE